MEDHSVSSHDDNDDDLIEPEDQVIIQYYLNSMINDGKSWPSHFVRDVNARVYNMNPWSFFIAHNPNYFLFVKRRTESCGKTDGSKSGCWRIMGRDKLIKSEETGKFLGFKKILKFCEKEKKRRSQEEEEEERRVWVMEEYRLISKWKQDQVICKIRLLPQPEVTSLLATHFSFLIKKPETFSPRRCLLPRFDLCVEDVPKDEIISYYLKMLLVDNRDDWPSHFLRSEQVYGVEPWRIVCALQSSLALNEGQYFFVNRTENCGRSDGCDGGCWRMIRRDKVIISKRSSKVLGFKRFYKFCHGEKPEFAKPVFKFEEDDVKVTWVMEEYRFAKRKMQGKVICKIRVLFPVPLDYLIRYGEV
ncbi:unnamed protein product [Microthlaspi erraticum]|uniref:NAC domain-containing protein n=1 Tax=Microthlaspi erraticum TaxID=1685480 RepID=A0A6D2IGB1_9BRAS|nr:unnamed protein product [Microthlaspi erraticum]